MNSKVIELINLKKIYDRTIILDINAFNFYKGGKYLLIGENGSGKSTLLKILLGLVKPNSGMIKNNYLNISYVPEKSILPDFINLKTFLKGYDIKKIIELAEIFDIDINKPFYKYSKGMRQKAIIIQAFITNSDVILFDEPINGLDQRSKEYFMSYVIDINKTIIISTHYLEQFIGYDFIKVKIIGNNLCLE